MLALYRKESTFIKASYLVLTQGYPDSNLILKLRKQTICLNYEGGKENEASTQIIKLRIHPKNHQSNHSEQILLREAKQPS